MRWLTTAVGVLVLTGSIMVSILIDQGHMKLETFTATTGTIGTIIGAGATGAYAETVRKRNEPTTNGATHD